MIALGDSFEFPALHIDALQVRPALLGGADVEVAAIRTPEWPAGAATAGRMLIAANAFVDVVVVVGGEIPGCGAGLCAGDKKIGLAVRADRRPLERGDEGDLISGRADR